MTQATWSAHPPVSAVQALYSFTHGPLPMSAHFPHMKHDRFAHCGVPELELAELELVLDVVLDELLVVLELVLDVVLDELLVVLEPVVLEPVVLEPVVLEPVVVEPV